MKTINNEKINHKFIFGLFNKPSVFEYLKLHTISKFYTRISLKLVLWSSNSPYGEDTYLTFINDFAGVEELLKFLSFNTHLKMQAIYFTQERRCYIKCVLGKKQKIKYGENEYLSFKDMANTLVIKKAEFEQENLKGQSRRID